MSNLNTYLLIDGYSIELDEAAKIPITKMLSDVKEPDKRQHSHSSTINIPGTQNNIRYFQRAYSLTWKQLDGVIIDLSYDSTIAHDCQLFINNKLEFKGYFQLLNTTIVNGNIVFEAALFSNIIGLFTKLKDITLQDLGWSEYDHTLTHTNIENSWDTSVIKNGVATSNFTSGVPDGFGYLYELVDYGFNTNLDEYNDNHIFPIVYQKEIIEKIFSYIGYTIDSTFIESELFKRLMLSNGSGEKKELSASEIDDLQVYLTGDGSGTFYTSGTQILSIYQTETYTGSSIIDLVDSKYVTITEVKDDINQYDNSLTSIPSSGTYQIDVSLDLDLTSTFTGTGSSTNFTYNNYILEIVVNGFPYTVDNGVVDMNGTTSISYTANRYLNVGDDYYFRIKLNYQGNLVSYTQSGVLQVDFDLNNTLAIDQDSLNNTVVGGSNIYMAQYVPNIKATDFLNSVIKHWNLYVSEPDSDGVVTIEPLEDFFNDASDYVTWTKKINTLEPIEVEPLAITQPKMYNYYFAEDKDYYNQDYRERFGIGYGDYVYENSTFFSKGESKVQLVYAVSPPVEILGTDLILPRIIKVDNGTVKPIKGKPRIYYYQGLRTGDWTLIGTGTESNDTYTEYPQLGTLDDIDSPTFDILFSYPQITYYDTSDYTQTNAFSEYHSRFINEVTSPDSKLLKAKFRLNSDDVKEGFLRDIINIDGVLYRINKVIDFTSTNETTQVELIKVIETKKRRTSWTVAPDVQVDIYKSQKTFGNTITLEKSSSFTVNPLIGTYNVDTSSRDVTVTLDPENFNELWKLDITKISSSNVMYIEVKSGSGYTINGQSRIPIYTEYTNIRIQKFNGNFYIR